MVNYQPMLKKYAYHCILMCLPGKHECNKLRRFFFPDINYSITESDYSEELKVEFEKKIQSESFLFNRTLSIEDWFHILEVDSALFWTSIKIVICYDRYIIVR